MPITNKGKLRILQWAMKNASPPTTFKAALVTTTPTVDTNTLSDLTEVAAGNGYTSGGINVERSATGWPNADDSEDDTNNRGSISAKDLVFTASGGTLPASGNPATYVVLTDDDATVADREVLAYWSLGGNRQVTDGNSITAQDATLRLTEPT